MRFSIVTVTFNNLAGLRSTMDSINWGEERLFEWIVIDGDSSDGTPQFLGDLRHGSFSFVSEPDRGIYDAMNKGIRRARGEYCIFMNAGDRFASDNVLTGVDALLGAQTPHIVYGDAIEYAGSNRWRKAARNPSKNFYSMFTHHQSIFYRTDLLRDGYDSSYRFSGDWAMTARILALPGSQSLRYPGAICEFERGGVSQTDVHRALINQEHWRICREESKLDPLTARIVWNLKIGVNNFRRRFPRLYDVLRFKASP